MRSIAIPSLLAAIAIATPMPQASTPSGAFTAWQNLDCSEQDGSRLDFQNLPNNACSRLTAANSVGAGSLRVSFLRASSCTLNVYTDPTCSTTAVYMYKADNVCHNVSAFQTYKIVC